MLSVDDALAAILAEVETAAAVSLPLREALGLTLAEEVASDVDSPPFNKALMDGYAVCSSDLPEGRATLRLLETITAGVVPTRTVKPGWATRIMTGAPIPAGADAVVRVEDTQPQKSADQESIVINGLPVEAGQNILPQGTSTRRGDRIVSAGQILRPQEIGALAEAGRDPVSVYPRPRVGILATGDELVPVSQTPQPGQIRNSNEAMLAAQVERFGAIPVPLGVAKDERSHLRERIEAGLECDLLLLSGGVSAGQLDLVPSELESAGVRQVFHKVRVKPGKPIWFGVRPEEEISATHSNNRCYVFGLPGNPVSSMVCCELFVRTAVRAMMGRTPHRAAPLEARLTHEHHHRGDRPTYYPARIETSLQGRTVSAVPWHGSADLRATVAANGMLSFPAGDCSYAEGSVMEVFCW